MKPRFALLYLLAAMLFTGPGLARAETKPAETKPVEKIDQGGLWKPGDNRADSAASPEARMRDEAIKRFDRNGDGKLDEAERAEMEKARAENMKKGGPGAPAPEAARLREEMLKRFDRNGDGKLDDDERAEMEKARQQVDQNGGVARFRVQMLKLFDKDGDGVLNETERGEAEKFRLEQIKRFDKDKDGRLNDDERGEALKAFVAEHPDMAPRRAK